MQSRLSNVFCLLVALASLSLAVGSQTFSVSTTYNTYDGALTSCQNQFGSAASLADYDTTTGRQAILATCSSFGCWVGGGVLPYGNGQWCPYLYAPPGYTPPSDYQINACSTYQRFICVYDSSNAGQPSTNFTPVTFTPPTQNPSPTPSPRPSPISSPPYAAKSPNSGAYPAPYPGPVGYPAPYPGQTYPSPYASPSASPKAPAPKPPSPPPPSSPSPPPSPPPPGPPPPLRRPSPPPATPPAELTPTVFSPPPSPGPVTYNPVEPSTAYTEYQLLPQLSMVVAVHLAAVPNTDLFLYMERPSGYHPDNSHVIAGTFDAGTWEWTNRDSPDGLFCCGHTMMSNGSVSIVGGHVANAGYPAGIHSIRTYTAGQQSLVKVTTMRFPRWYPTATLLPTSQILITGGTQGVGAGTANNPYYEIWDPTNPLTTQQFPVEAEYLREVRQNYYPFMFVMPSGDMWEYCGRSGWLMNPYNATYLQRVPGRPLSLVSPSTVYTTQYPYTGTAVLLPMRSKNNYTVDVLIMGGQDIAANVNLSISACSESIRIKVTPYGGVWREYGTYNFSDWEQEWQGSPRVMGDSVLLPNGKVILLNGAQQGLAGDSASGGDSRANYPNFFAEMYDPDAPFNSRWQSLNRSQISRLYHSTAALTTNGTILVTGCDRCWKIISNLNFSAPPHKAEYRNEIFYPPFWYATDKPAIVSSPKTTSYGQTFTIKYTGETDPSVVVDQVVIVAPSSTTHCFNTNQRVVELDIVSSAPGQVVVRAPPSRNHAPPQFYMLFVLNGDSYSKAKWIQLTN